MSRLSLKLSGRQTRNIHLSPSTMEGEMAAVKALYTYLAEKYGPGVAHKEHPFMYRNGLGQVVGGSIDLLWETAEGVVVVDYMNYPGYDDVTCPDKMVFTQCVGTFFLYAIFWQGEYGLL